MADVGHHIHASQIHLSNASGCIDVSYLGAASLKRIAIPLRQIAAHLSIILIAGHRMRYDAGHIKDSVSRCLEAVLS